MKLSRQQWLTAVVAVICLGINASRAQNQPLLAPTPPMGWNSWDSYGQTVTEEQVRATARWMASHLKKFGWQYVVIDEGWYVINPQGDAKSYQFALSLDGRYLPAARRFPSSGNGRGLKPLADYIHSLGLKFGIHIIRGIPREAVRRNLPVPDSSFHAAEAADDSDVCPWNTYNYGIRHNAAGQAYYDSIAKLYADWGVDYVKADCIADHPYKPEEIRMIRQALEGTGRPMVLSLSPGPTAVAHAEYGARYSELWRISDDFWDHWGIWPKHEWSQGLYAQFANAVKWAALPPVPGHWPDADMLPLGWLGPHPGEGEPRKTRFTRDEQVSLVTLWAMFRSPLMMGGNLVSNDPWTTRLLSNAEVIAIDQHSKDNRAVVATARTAVWTARPEQGQDSYVAVFNLSDEPQELHFAWNELGLNPGTYDLRNLWTQEKSKHTTSLQVKLKPHGCALWRATLEKNRIIRQPAGR